MGLRAIKIPKYRVKLFHHRDTVYPIPGYGAIEIGAHRFYEKKAGKDDVASGEAKFMHIWQNNDGAWKVT